MRIENGWAFAPEVMDLLRAMLPERPGVHIGWSLGGMRILDRLLDGEEGIEAVVLLGSTLSFRQRANAPYGTPESQLRAIRMALDSEPETVLENFNRGCFAPDRAPHWGDVLHRDVDVLRQGLRDLDRFDFTRSDFPEIPALVLHGTEDQITSPEAARPLAEALGTEPVYIDGAGHALPLTHTEWVAAHTLRLLDTLDG